MALISARPPAAALPLKKAVGRPQNGGRQLQRPDTASVAAASATRGGTKSNDGSVRPIAAHTEGHTTCQRRSPNRSDRRPHQTITKTVMRAGIALSSPSWVLVTPAKALLRILGMKKSNPYAPMTIRK